MFKISHAIFCAMTIWTAVLLFWTSQSVQNAEKELNNIKKSNYRELEMVRVLSSEWDYLNRPDRLEKLAVQYLTVETIGTHADKMLTSVDLIEEQEGLVVPPATVKENVGLVSKKNNLVKGSTKAAEPKVIKKVEQEEFKNMIINLTEED